MIAASPCPPPPHSAAAPSPPPAPRARAEPATTPAQLVHERDRDARARHADRVTERDRTAVDVDDVVGDAEVAPLREADGREGFVELEQVDVGDLAVDWLERALDRARRLREQGRVRSGDHAEAPQLGDGRDAQLVGLLATHYDDGRRAVGDL